MKGNKIFDFSRVGFQQIINTMTKKINECVDIVNDMIPRLDEYISKVDWNKIINSDLYQNVISELGKTNEQMDIIKKKHFTNTLYVDPNTGQFKSIKAALDYAIKNGVAKNNRYTICINNGVYNEKLNLVDGIDLVGSSTENTIITYKGTSFRQDDTVNASCDCSIRNITIIQDSNGIQADLQNYPIHIDGNPQENMNVAIENCKTELFGNTFPVWLCRCNSNPF